MAHAKQERYSALVDAKLRQTLVTKDNLIFNNKYEGNPKAGVVKIPVRDTEVEVGSYNSATGMDLNAGTTTYISLSLNKDKAVNELIDGFDAATVPDNIVADRIDSAGYSLGLQIDKDSIGALEGTAGVKQITNTAITTNPYKDLMKARTYLSRTGVPMNNRFAIVAPEVLEVLMTDSNFIKQSDLSQELVMQGVVGRAAGFNIFESCNMKKDEETTESTKKYNNTTEFICGHSDFCHRVEEWQVPVHLQDLNGSGKYIGASAIQGRKIYGVLVSKPSTVYVQATKIEKA